jgi:5-(carboxyamino)imidazole ribonucleotide synthase
MLALAGYRLGLHFRFVDPAPDACAGQVGELVVGAYEDLNVLERFRQGLDVVTYEFESVPVAAVRWLAQHLPVFPPPAALEAAQDRLREKTLFQQVDIPTAPFAAVQSEAELHQALRTLGCPAVLKTRRLGYDGKGQFVLRNPDDVPAAWTALGGVPLLLEQWVPFERELSLVTVTGRDGRVVAYPLVENHHEGGILRRTIAPAPGLTADLQARAEAKAERVIRALDYVGVLAIEFFEHEGRLLANEMAPRVHNSGHWTIDAARTSQFENHLRAIVGWPLGSPAPVGRSTMVNLIGQVPPIDRLLSLPGARTHLYGKSPGPGRKLGHVTLLDHQVGNQWDEATTQLERFDSLRRAGVVDGAPLLRGPQ